MPEKTVLDVRGMTCSSCASGISRHLEKMGLNDIQVHFDSGEVEAYLPEGWNPERLCKEIDRLGYQSSQKGHEYAPGKWALLGSSLGFRFLFCAFFSTLLLLHMFLPWNILHQPLFQFLLCIPVMFIGWQHFGKSALGAIRSGTSNMDVLISLGSGSAFIYSCIAWFRQMDGSANGPQLYFETAATIITLLLLGNLIERRSLKSTQAGLEALIRIQPDKAHRIVDPMTDRERTETVESSQLRPNDLVLIPTGSKIPADGLVYEGTADIDTSLMTGESLLRSVGVNDSVYSGTVVSDGHLKIIVQHSGTETALSRMIDTVRSSALRKPAIQRSGDRLSAVFVPVVIGLAVITFVANLWWTGLDTGESLLRAIAVLVISCPCAMGLATPTAVSVGIGKAARSGILVKGGDTLERLSQVSTVVFDKTGTLTEGRMQIEHIHYNGEEKVLQALIGTLEQYSSHPYAITLTNSFGHLALPADIRFRDIREEKGKGVEAITTDERCYRIGSAAFAGGTDAESTFQVFLSCNGVRLASIRFSDTVRNEAAGSIQQLHALGIHTVLLSGDRLEHCLEVASQTGIKEVYGEKLPGEKADVIRILQQKGPVAMVGDGINDSAAMAIADVGIAMGKGTSIAIKTAEVVLMNREPLSSIPVIRHLSKDTLLTIRQNLGWALAYNLVAIPMAASGLLSPLLASLSMAFSDVVVIGNSLRLHLRKTNVQP